MPPSLTLRKVFTKEPYRSIVNLLIEFKTEGLELKDIQYTLMKEHYLYAVGKEKRKFLDNKVQKLILSGKVVKYKMKSINRTKKKNKNKEEKTEKAKVIRSNILNFLKKIEAIDIIYKDGDRYKIKEAFYNEGIREQNKNRLDSFPQDQIIDFSVESSVSCVVYGLTKSLYYNFSDDEIANLENSLIEIEKNIQNIEKIRIKKMAADRDKRIDLFLRTTKSDKIKKALRKKSSRLWYAITDSLMNNLSFRDSIAIKDVFSLFRLMPKRTFYYSFGWIFDVPNGETNSKWGYGCLIKPFSGRLSCFQDDYLLFGSWKDLSESKEKKYLKAWSEDLFSKDYDFSKDEVREIIEWCWNNRDHFFVLPHLPVAFFRYKDYDEKFLTESISNS